MSSTRRVGAGRCTSFASVYAKAMRARRFGGVSRLLCTGRRCFHEFSTAGGCMQSASLAILNKSQVTAGAKRQEREPEELEGVASGRNRLPTVKTVATSFALQAAALRVPSQLNRRSAVQVFDRSREPRVHGPAESKPKPLQLYENQELSAPRPQFRTYRYFEFCAVRTKSELRPRRSMKRFAMS